MSSHGVNVAVDAVIFWAFKRETFHLLGLGRTLWRGKIGIPPQLSEDFSGIPTLSHPSALEVSRCVTFRKYNMYLLPDSPLPPVV